MSNISLTIGIAVGMGAGGFLAEIAKLGMASLVEVFKSKMSLKNSIAIEDYKNDKEYQEKVNDALGTGCAIVKDVRASVNKLGLYYSSHKSKNLKIPDEPLKMASYHNERLCNFYEDNCHLFDDETIRLILNVCINAALVTLSYEIAEKDELPVSECLSECENFNKHAQIIMRRR